MKTLIVDDDPVSRLLLQGCLKVYGATNVAVNGKEAVEAMRLALEANDPYDLICLDIMMPMLDGHGALKQIRALEADKGIWSSHGAKVVMTTALGDMKNVNTAFGSLCDAYLVKPIAKAKLLEVTKLKIADLTTTDLEAASRIMAGTARQMGLEIVG